MKKTFAFIFTVLFTKMILAQLPVSTAPQNKKAVLENFTALYCGYSPDGDRIAASIYNADPNNIVLIHINSGGYANVNVGEPDFKTTGGNAIDPMTGMLISGYPAGAVNRMVMPGSQTPGGMAESRGSWSVNCNTIKTQSAYCNVALQGTIDATTRILTVEAQVYYTSNSPAATNSLTIMLLEDSIPGVTHNFGFPIPYNAVNYNADGSYNHNRVLRTTLTGNFGIPVSPTTMGSTYNGTFTYTIPAAYGAAGKTTQALLGRLRLAAFVTQTNSLTINGANGPLVINNYPNSLDVGISDITTTDGSFYTDPIVCSAFLRSNFKFVNYGSTTVTQAVFSYDVNGGAPMTYTWTGSLAPMTM